MPELDDKERKEFSDSFAALVDKRYWDEALSLFSSIHTNGELPLVICHENRIRLMELSLNRDVEIPTEYFFMATNGQALKGVLLMLKAEVQRNSTITAERAISTLDMLAKACSEVHEEHAQASAAAAVVKRALALGFPVEIFHRTGRFHEIKRHAAELSFGL